MSAKIKPTYQKLRMKRLTNYYVEYDLSIGNSQDKPFSDHSKNQRSHKCWVVPRIMRRHNSSAVSAARLENQQLGRDQSDQLFIKAILCHDLGEGVRYHTITGTEISTTDGRIEEREAWPTSKPCCTLDVSY